MVFSYAITIALSAIFITGSAFVIKIIVECASAKNIQLLKERVIIALMYSIGLFLIEYLRRTCRAGYLKYSILDLKRDLFNSLVDRDIITFEKENSAMYISILNNDVKMVEYNFFDTIFIIIHNTAMLISAIILMIYINIFIGITAVVLSLFPVLIPMIFGNMLARLKENYSKALQVYNVKIKDIFTGFEIIKSFNIEKNIKENHSKINYST